MSAPEAAAALEAAFAALAGGAAYAQPRHTIGSQALELSTMAAILPAAKYAAAKIYTRMGNRYSFVVLLFSAADGRLLATFDAGELTKLRTAAVTGIAARRMARADARRLVVFGRGRQASAHIAVLPQLLPIESIRVVCRTDAREYCERMAREVGIEVVPADAGDALARADIVVTATFSPVPLFDGALLREGTFVAALGSVVPQATELGADTIRRCDRIAVEALDLARHEAGDLIQACAAGVFDWQRALSLGDLVAGRALGRGSAHEITLFKSVGSALSDVAVAALAYQKLSGRG